MLGWVGNLAGKLSCWKRLLFVCIKKLFRSTGLETFNPRKNLCLSAHFAFFAYLKHTSPWLSSISRSTTALDYVSSKEANPCAPLYTIR